MRNRKEKLLVFLIVFLANTLFMPLCSVFAEENAEPPVVDSSADKTATSKNSTSPEALAQEQSGKKALTSGADGSSASSGKTESPKNSSSKYSAPVDEKNLEVKAITPEKKNEEKKVAQNSSTVSAPNSEAPSSQKPPVEPPPIKRNDSSLVPGKTKNSNENYEPEFKNETQTPGDLPDVDAEEVSLPQVVAKQDDTESSVNILFIIAAWCLIALGMLVVVFVILNGKRRRTGGEGLGSRSSRKRKKGGLLAGRFYKK